MKTDEAIAIELMEKWQGTGGGMLEAIKEALAIGRCQEFERRTGVLKAPLAQYAQSVEDVVSKERS